MLGGCIVVNERRFRFGVTVGQIPNTKTWLEMARRAESSGFSTFLQPDTLFTPAPLPTLAAAAAATTTLRVGSWVLCDSLREPRMLAWEAATVDQLSDGRLELGLGVGRPDAEKDAARLGIPFGSPGQRVQRLEASVRTLKGLLSGGEPGFPAGVQRPHVPILIAASGPRLLAFAAREADIVVFGWPADTTMEAAQERIGMVRDAAPDRFDHVELAAGLIAIGDDEHPWLRRMGLDVRALAAGGAITVLTGTPSRMADTLRRRRDTLGLSYLTVPIQSAETFAPVVEMLSGN
jgi:probable F420-dependent oxidoreductase